MTNKQFELVKDICKYFRETQSSNFLSCFDRYGKDIKIGECKNNLHPLYLQNINERNKRPFLDVSFRSICKCEKEMCPINKK